MTLLMESAYTGELEAALAATGVTGASFAYWDGDRLHRAAAGLRNSVTRDPVTLDTVMQIGSITKVMTAALLMQLVDDGLISLTDPVVKHLPDLRIRDAAALQRITCEMLVNHTSGIDGMNLPEWGPDQERIVDAINYCPNLGQVHAPGEATSYCNIGTVIAGYLAQRLLGQSWYTLVKKRIYDPLGMDHSLVEPSDLPRFRCSIGDITDFKTGRLVQTAQAFLSASIAPCGTTQYATAQDVVTFARAIIGGGLGPNGGRILSKQSADRMKKPTAKFLLPDDVQMGLGWMILPGNILFHGGGGRGVNSLLYSHPDTGQAVVLLTNCDQGVALKQLFLDPILRTWPGFETKPMQHAARDAKFPLESYIGTYENNYYRFQVFARDGELAMRRGFNGEQMSNLHELDMSLTATLRALGDDLFEAEFHELGVPKEENFKLVKFARPAADGRMQLMGRLSYLLKRVQ